MELRLLVSNTELPSTDMCSCSRCTWEGKVEACSTVKDGCWEEGFYDVHICPVCEQNGVVGLIETYW